MSPITVSDLAAFVGYFYTISSLLAGTCGGIARALPPGIWRERFVVASRVLASISIDLAALKGASK